MYKWLLALVVTIGLVGGAVVTVLNSLVTADSKSQVSSVLEVTDVSTTTSQVNPLIPTQLNIPKLNLSAQVELVGLDSQGRMDVPKADENVAWFQLGVKPGQMGSSVIAGHYDSKTGDPAIFYGLTELVPGDKIKVEGENGEELEFVVTETATYQDATFPLDKVFARADARRLNLITCAGHFDQAANNYSDRFVVFTTLVEPVY